MKARQIPAAAALVLAIAGVARANFVLESSEHLDVTTSHGIGVLWDSSTADVLSGAYIDDAYVNDEALLRVRPPTSATVIKNAWVYNTGQVAVSSGRVTTLRAYDTSIVDVSGGSVPSLYAYDSSIVDFSSGNVSILDASNTSIVGISGGSVYSRVRAYDTSIVGISGGSVPALYAYDTSIVDISGGSIPSLVAYETSSVDISGGSVSSLIAYDTSIVDISGGSVPSLRAYDTSIVTLHGRDFRATGGLSLVEYDIIDGVPQYEVIGTGVLTGRWSDTPLWALRIETNPPDATILAVPEPATLGLLAFGALAVVGRRRR